MIRIIGISLAFLACTQLRGQERFYNFIEGWRNSFSAETDSSYMLIGLSNSQGIGLNEHRLNIISLEGDSITSSINMVDSLDATECRGTSSGGVLVNDAIVFAGYGCNLSADRCYGTLFNYSFDGQGIEFAVFDEDQVNFPQSITSSNDTTLLIGSQVSDFATIRKMFIYDTDMQGNQRWSFQSQCGPFCNSSPEQILPLSDGNIAILFYEYDGSFPTYEETLRTVLLKLNSVGEELWRRYPGDWEGNHINPGGIVELDGEILVSFTDPYFYNENDQWEFNDSGSVHLIRYDLDGNFLTEIDYLEEMYNNLDSARVIYDVSQMQQLEDGNILLTGSTGPGGLMMKIDPTGSLIWFREHLWHPLEINGGFSQDTWLNHVLPTSDGGFLGTGEFRHSPTIEYPFSIQTAIALKVDEYGCLEPGCQLVDGVVEYPSSSSGASSLKVWPNPTRAELRVEIPHGINPSDIVFVEVQDELGRKVDSRFQTQDLEYGVLSVESLPSGIYFLQLVTSEQVYSAKFIKE